MLLELNVSQFAIINNIQVKFGKGLNILSGETGAGKSILLKSLALLMGEKASAESVRTGAEQAVIEGLFDISNRKDIIERLEAAGIQTDDGTLVVRRLVSNTGKSKVYINGALSTLSILQSIVAPLIEVTGQSIPLIEMTGQHDNRNLLSKTYHLDILDAFAGATRDSYRKEWKRLKEIETEMSAIAQDTRMREQRLDFLKFQRDEIKALDLQPGEDLSLQNNYERIKNSSRLNEWAQQSEAALLTDDESAIVRLHTVISKGNDIKKYDATIDERLRPLVEAKSLIEDFTYGLRSYSSELESDESLDRIESRLSDLRKLQKKYGATSQDILNSLSAIEAELQSLENSDTRLEELKKEYGQIQLSLKKTAEQLHQKRVQSAKHLATAVNDELSELNMKGVIFVVELTKLDQLNAYGLSDCEFMIKASSKDPARPISKVASGGELSRILLSLKNTVGVGDFPRCYLFDEVDTGVSGPTAEKVGKKLKVIAKGQQVLCVTHLPQVAAFADHHFFIQKSQGKTGVSMEVNELTDKQQVEEIARLISGEKITKTSLDHARELLKG
jgi:DNA repair protein RecN (Recombination protein N)